MGTQEAEAVREYDPFTEDYYKEIDRQKSNLNYYNLCKDHIADSREFIEKLKNVVDEINIDIVSKRFKIVKTIIKDKIIYQSNGVEISSTKPELKELTDGKISLLQATIKKKNYTIFIEITKSNSGYVRASNSLFTCVIPMTLETMISVIDKVEKNMLLGCYFYL